MNILITVVFLVMSVVALQYNAWVMFGGLLLAAIVASPRAWTYTIGAGLLVFLLRYFHFPSWDVLSFLVIGVAYGVMGGIEKKREEKQEIPPELLAYMLAGGGRAAP